MTVNIEDWTEDSSIIKNHNNDLKDKMKSELVDDYKVAN
jgi:hypothetical protein